MDIGAEREKGHCSCVCVCACACVCVCVWGGGGGLTVCLVLQQQAQMLGGPAATERRALSPLRPGCPDTHPGSGCACMPFIIRIGSMKRMPNNSMILWWHVSGLPMCLHAIHYETWYYKCMPKYSTISQCFLPHHPFLQERLLHGRVG